MYPTWPTVVVASSQADDNQRIPAVAAAGASDVNQWLHSEVASRMIRVNFPTHKIHKTRAAAAIQLWTSNTFTAERLGQAPSNTMRVPTTSTHLLNRPDSLKLPETDLATAGPDNPDEGPTQGWDLMPLSTCLKISGLPELQVPNTHWPLRKA